MENLFKKSIFILFICLFAFQITAKDLDPNLVPAKVKEKLLVLYPTIKNEISWKRNMGKYQADFNFNNKSISYVFSKNGEILFSKVEIDNAELPANISELIKMNYLDNNFKIIYTMKRIEKNVELYEVEVMKGRLIYIVRYNLKGTVMNIFELDKRDILNFSYTG